MSGGLTVEGSYLRSSRSKAQTFVQSTLHRIAGLRWLLATHLTVQYSAMLSLNMEDK